MPQQQAVELYIQELFETDPEWEAKYAVTDDLVRQVYIKMNRNAGTEQNLISIVFHNLHGQASLLMIWENGNENSGLVIFAPELILPFAQINLSYCKTAMKE